MQLKDKRIIVTGGASGVAAATVRLFVREGASVVSVDINDEAGTAVVEEANREGPGQASYHRCDIADRAETTRVFTDAIARLGGLDALANIAGNEQQKPAEDVTDADIDMIFDAHVRGTINSNQAAFTALKAHGGSIINYSSFAGVRGFPGMPVYSAAKAAVLGWTRVIAQDWGRFKIRANAVCPAVMTALARQWFDEMPPAHRASIEAWFKQTIPLGGTLGEPEDAANLNLFLASDAARFITGQTLAVDGGQMMLG